MKYYESLNQGNLRIIELLEKINQNGIKIIDDFWQNLIIQGAGAFFGAFFAFLFGGLAFFIKTRRDRFILHKNALVEIEYLLNEHLNDIAKNSYLIEHDLEIIKKEHLTYDRLYELRLPAGIELKLGDLEIINRYSSYRESILRINADFNKINKALDLISNYAVTHDKKVHSDNFKHLAEQMETVNKFLKLLTNETKELLAYTRIYMQRVDSLKEKRLNIYKLNGYREITEEELKEEQEKLNKEIEQTMKESKERIKQAIG